MPDIPIPQTGREDIYSFGFDKNLNRGQRQVSSTFGHDYDSFKSFESNITFDPDSGHDHDGENSKVVSPDGWLPASENWAFSSADAPSYVMSAPRDLTDKYSVGMKIRIKQKVTDLTSKWPLEDDSTDVVASNDGTDTDITYDVAHAKYGDFGATLNGTTSKIVIAEDASLEPTGNFTAGFWCKTPTDGRNIFQASSQNPNIAGWLFNVQANGQWYFRSGANTGTTLGTDYMFAIAPLTFAPDDNWQWVVGTWDGSTLWLYINGDLATSTPWSIAPGYAGTNYIRIGCGNASGADLSFWNGEIDDVFFINGTALSGTEIADLYAADKSISTALAPRTSYFIVTNVVYNSPNTEITMYGGTDYELTADDIKDVIYSMHKAPYGFPVNPGKWTVLVQKEATTSQSTPTQNTWYNHTSIDIPLGIWDVNFQAYVFLRADTAGSQATYVQTTLSTANNTESSTSHTTASGGAHDTASGNDVAVLGMQHHFIPFFTLTTKRTYYLNFRATSNTGDLLQILGATLPTKIWARCAYL